MSPDRLVAGRYRVCAELGSGGFGAVYRVEDTHAGGAMRALKTLKPNASISQLAERFQEEARALSSLKHAGVPKCWDFGEDDEIGLFFVLDYIQGQTLLDRMEAGSMPLTERFQRAIEFFDVLGHVHGRGILHRDIKPENLMVPKDGGHLILLDFGIAKDLAQSAVHTATGVILGTPYYLTPEQLMGERYTAKSDMYQAALVTYWLLTGGSHCFAQVDSVAQLMVQRQMAPKVGALERTSWFGRVRGFVKPLLDCLEPKPENRPGTARIVRDALTAMRDAVVGEGRVAPPTVDGVARPARKVSGKVSQPTVAQPASSAAQTAVVDHSIGGAKVVSPGGIPLPPASGPGASVHSLRALAALIALTLVGGGVVIAMQAGALPPVKDRPTSSPVSVAVSSPAPASEEAERGRAVQTGLTKARLDIDWLKRFASQHRTLLRKSPGAVRAVLRQQLEPSGALNALERFLPVASAYFSNAAIPESERWATRSALSDVELIEYFCEDHKLPAPFDRAVAQCAGSFDDRFDPASLALEKAEHRVASYSWYESKRGSQLDSFVDVWKVGKPAAGSQCWVWTSVLNWRPGLVIRVTVANRFRRLLRYQQPTTDPGPIDLRMTEFRKAREANLHRIVLLERTNLQGQRGYVGRRIPANLIDGSTSLQFEILDVPLSPTGSKDANLWDRILTIVP